MPLVTVRAMFAGLPAVDWENPAAIRAGVDPLYDAFEAEPDLLLQLLDDLPGNPDLVAMCERYDFMDKLVLLSDPSGVRLRLHRYRKGFFDRPHNHRWSFATQAWRCGYLHRVFGSDENFNEHTDPSTLTPICEQVLQTGGRYALHHTAVHTVQADEETISLLIRGPAAKDRFLVHDIADNRFFWVTGAAMETPQTRASKQMSPEVLTATINEIRQLLAQAAGAR